MGNCWSTAWRQGEAINRCAGVQEDNEVQEITTRRLTRLQPTECPGVPGCWSQSKTEQQALEKIQYAIREYFEAVAMISKGCKIREVEVLM